MGCDIHACIEYHEYPDDHWSTFAILGSTSRWYALFGALTNGEVRGFQQPAGNPAIDPRGFPPDAGWETKDQYEEDGTVCLDWHTPSWVSVDEFAAALTAAGNDANEYWDHVLATMRSLATKWPTRLIFWFDN